MSGSELRNMVERLSPYLRQSLEEAASLCMTRSHFTIEIEHWLLSLLSDFESDISLFLACAKIDPQSIKNDFNKSLEKLKSGNMRSPAFSEYTVTLIREAIMASSLEFKDSEVRSFHLFYALCFNSNLKRLAFSISPIFETFEKRQFLTFHPELLANKNEKLEDELQSSDSRSNNSGKKESSLSKYTVDLTELCEKNKIDPIVGRDFEINQMIDILLRRKQNNPILVGEAGVGKTSVVDGLAQNIVEGSVPDALIGTKVLSLDMTLLQAGASVKGEFEKRLKGVIEEVKKSATPIIIFIDEVHNLIGAGGGEGTGDAANILKPALSRGELKTIGATTWREYKKYFEKDAALTRRFQLVKVLEPDLDNAIHMMRKSATVLTKHHEVEILEEALVSSVTLSQRYIPGRFLPDKSYSLLDTACSRVKMSQAGTPSEILLLEKNIERLKEEKSAHLKEESIGLTNRDKEIYIDQISNKLEEEVCRLTALNSKWQQEKSLVEDILNKKKNLNNDSLKVSDIRSQLKEFQKETPMVFEWVDTDVIAGVIKDWTGIPVGRLAKNEIEKLLTLNSKLKERVVGQDHALELISESIKNSQAKISEPNCPIGVFLLVGTSGVGKTETALALSESLYGSDENITVINMSEFKEEHKVSLLMGSPPGYVGYGEGGVLTEAVRKQPYSVVLLDEIEKAHPGVQDIFYQVFDKGTLRDGEGRDIDFKNTIIIMTSNVGTETILRMCGSEEGASIEDLEEGIKGDLLKSYKPAFLGRTKIVPFFPLSPDVLKDIINLKLAKIVKRFETNYHSKLSFDDSSIQYILGKLHDPRSGARAIQQIINNELLPKLSNLILEKLVVSEPVNSIVVEEVEGEFIVKMEVTK